MRFCNFSNLIILGFTRGFYMGDYKINIVNLNVTNNYVELTAELEGDRELYYPRISACFYGENDNRILPMDLKSCNKNKAIAIGIFDTPFLFYNNRKSQNVRVNFLLRTITVKFK